MMAIKVEISGSIAKDLTFEVICIQPHKALVV